MAKVLFVYPNEGNSLRIPLAISILSACLKENGHEVYIFDPTFFRTNYGKDYELMESRNVVKKTEFENIIGELPQKDMRKELKKVINISKPDFVAISLIERNYVVFKNLLAIVKEEIPDVPLLVGGILPSLCPDLVLDDPQVDYICIGEGEKLIVDFADKIYDVKELKKIPNLCFKNGDTFIRNSCGPLTDLSKIPFQDWSGFDRRQLLKPFEGKIYRGGSFEFSRGCYKICKFCVAPQLRGIYSASGKKYHRIKKPGKAVEEIAIKKDQYDLEINAFCDTDFLAAVPVAVLSEFCELYKSDVGLPFMIQTSAETIT
nr:cobalamin B12-binding domain-containing protein [Bacteroidota bacterium]